MLCLTVHIHWKDQCWSYPSTLTDADTPVHVAWERLCRASLFWRTLRVHRADVWRVVSVNLVSVLQLREIYIVSEKGHHNMSVVKKQRHLKYNSFHAYVPLLLHYILYVCLTERCWYLSVTFKMKIIICSPAMSFSYWPSVGNLWPKFQYLGVFEKLSLMFSLSPLSVSVAIHLLVSIFVFYVKALKLRM